MLAAADLVSLLCFAGALALFADGGAAIAGWAAILFPVWIVLAKLEGLYDADHRTLRRLTVDELPGIFIWTVLVAIGTVSFISLARPDRITPVDALEAWAVIFVVAVASRAGARGLWRRVTPPERTAIIGSGPLLKATRRKLDLFADLHVELVEVRSSCTAAELRGQPEWLTGLDRIIVATETLEEPLLGELITTCRARKLKLGIVPPGHEQLGTAVRLSEIADLHVLDYNTWDVSRSTLLLKRTLDITLASLGLLLLAPVFLGIAAVVLGEDGRPVFFRQRRAGLRGRPFRMIKFRTMVVGADEQLSELLRLDELDEPVFKLPDDPRTTASGRVLRRLSLDELPQLWNVLRGEMSLVGPRPEQVELVERYRPEQRIRLFVKPGMTGPMQVYGRASLTFDERLALERDYVQNLSVLRDLRIIAMTIVPVFQRRGAS